MSDATARAIAERYCQAWRDGDLAGVLDCYAPDFTLHYFGRSVHAGDHVGKDAAVTALAAVSSEAARTLVEVEEILASDGGAVIVARERLERAGATYELRRLFRYRVVGDHFAECWLYDEDQALVDRLWGTRA